MTLCPLDVSVTTGHLRAVCVDHQSEKEHKAVKIHVIKLFVIPILTKHRRSGAFTLRTRKFTNMHEARVHVRLVRKHFEALFASLMHCGTCFADLMNVVLF